MSADIELQWSKEDFLSLLPTELACTVTEQCIDHIFQKSVQTEAFPSRAPQPHARLADPAIQQRVLQGLTELKCSLEFHRFTSGGASSSDDFDEVEEKLASITVAFNQIIRKAQRAADAMDPVHKLAHHLVQMEADTHLWKLHWELTRLRLTCGIEIPTLTPVPSDEKHKSNLLALADRRDVLQRVAVHAQSRCILRGWRKQGKKLQTRVMKLDPTDTKEDELAYQQLKMQIAWFLSKTEEGLALLRDESHNNHPYAAAGITDSQKTFLDALARLHEQRRILPEERAWIALLIDDLLYDPKRFSDKEIALLEAIDASILTLDQCLDAEANGDLRETVELLRITAPPSLRNSVQKEMKKSADRAKHVKRELYSLISQYLHRPAIRVHCVKPGGESFGYIQEMWYSELTAVPPSLQELSHFAPGYSAPSISDKYPAESTPFQATNLGTIHHYDSNREPTRLLATRSGKPNTEHRVKQILVLQAKSLLSLPESAQQGLTCLDDGSGMSDEIPRYSFRGTLISHLNGSSTLGHLAEENEWEYLTQVCASIDAIRGQEVQLTLPDGTAARVRLERPRFLHIPWNWVVTFGAGEKKAEQLSWLGLHSLYQDALCGLESLLGQQAAHDQARLQITAIRREYHALRVAAEYWEPPVSLANCLTMTPRDHDEFWDSSERKSYEDTLEKGLKELYKVLDGETSNLPTARLVNYLYHVVYRSDKLSQAQWLIYLFHLNEMIGAIDPTNGPPPAISCKSGDDRTLSAMALLLALQRFKEELGFAYEPVIHDDDPVLRERFADSYLGFVIKLGWEQSVMSKGDELPFVRWGGGGGLRKLAKNRCAREYLPSDLAKQLEQLLFEH